MVVHHQIPRITKDLDLFTTSEEHFEHSQRLLVEVCQELSAGWEALRKAPQLGRYRVHAGGQSTLVDLVLDTVPQLYPEKLVQGSYIVDVPEEILINKICSIVGRGEGRDFVDAYFLVARGLDPHQALMDANCKDGGVNETSMLYVLTDTDWDRFQVPGVEASLVQKTADFFKVWTRELACRALPPN